MTTSTCGTLGTPAVAHAGCPREYSGHTHAQITDPLSLMYEDLQHSDLGLTYWVTALYNNMMGHLC